MSPQTLGGTMLAQFLRGLFPETEQFDDQIAHIEREAATQERERLLSADEDGIRATIVEWLGPQRRSLYLNRDIDLMVRGVVMYRRATMPPEDQP